MRWCCESTDVAKFGDQNHRGESLHPSISAQQSNSLSIRLLVGDLLNFLVKLFESPQPIIKRRQIEIESFGIGCTIKFESGEPGAMFSRPVASVVIDKALRVQELRKLMLGSSDVFAQSLSAANKTSDGFVLRIGNANVGQQAVGEIDAQILSIQSVILATVSRFCGMTEAVASSTCNDEAMTSQ